MVIMSGDPCRAASGAVISPKEQKKKRAAEPSVGVVRKVKKVKKEKPVQNIGRWSPNEHRNFEKALIAFVAARGFTKLPKWKYISNAVGSRNPKQCRSHAQKVWTADEHKKFTQAVKEFATAIPSGCIWDYISKAVFTRNAQQCRSHAQKVWTAEDFLRFEEAQGSGAQPKLILGYASFHDGQLRKVVISDDVVLDSHLLQHGFAKEEKPDYHWVIDVKTGHKWLAKWFAIPPKNK